MQMVRQCPGLHLISKLRNDAALYLLYDGPQKAKGRKRHYAPKVSSTIHNGVQTDIYQAMMLHKSFAEMLNVVIIVRTTLRIQCTTNGSSTFIVCASMQGP